MPELTALARHWVKSLNMSAHPEGGYYAEVYRSNGLISAEALPEHAGARNFLTSIYFMLSPGDVSRFHRLKSDEIWYYHAGSSLTLYSISGKGACEARQLGPDLIAGESLQLIVPAGSWFGAVPNGPEAVLVSCAVAPGFDFADFEMASRKDLQQQFPQHASIIEKLT